MNLLVPRWSLVDYKFKGVLGFGILLPKDAEFKDPLEYQRIPIGEARNPTISYQQPT